MLREFIRKIRRCGKYSYFKMMTTVIDGLDESADTLPLALMAIARQVSEENLEDAMEGLSYEIRGTFLEELDEDNLRVEFRTMLATGTEATFG